MRSSCWIIRIPCRCLPLLMAIALVSIFGCSQAPEDPAWFQSTATGKVLSDEVLIGRIRSAGDPIAIYRMREEYRLRGGDSAEAKDALEQRLAELVSTLSPLGSPCPEADLIAFDYRKVGPADYRADYLFRVNQPFEQDLRIGLYGTVAPEHLDRISGPRRAAGKKSEFWQLIPSPATSTWTPGKEIFLSQHVNASPIPYNLSMIFYDPSREPGRHGQTVQLGWRRGVTEEVLIESIKGAASLIDLYRLEGDCDNLPKVREAFLEKAKELQEGTESLGALCPEADLLAFDFRRIGEDRYRVDYLFQVNRPLNFDCLITLYGVVDENHLELLSEQRKQLGKRSEEWSFRPQPPTGDWRAGEHVLISSEIEARPIPYKMQTILYDRDNRRPHGDQVHLGWRADPGEPAAGGD